MIWFILGTLSFVGSQYMDVISSMKGLKAGGYEANPLLSRIFRKWGWLGIIKVKAAAAAFFPVFIFYASHGHSNQAGKDLLVMSSIFWLVVTWNYLLIYIRRPIESRNSL